MRTRRYICIFSLYFFVAASKYSVLPYLSEFSQVTHGRCTGAGPGRRTDERRRRGGTRRRRRRTRTRTRTRRARRGRTRPRFLSLSLSLFFWCFHIIFLFVARCLWGFPSRASCLLSLILLERSGHHPPIFSFFLHLVFFSSFFCCVCVCVCVCSSCGV